jgi:uncharacterized membrane protein (DUF2068 family)
MGEPRFVTLTRLIRTLVIVVAIPAGWHYGGVLGVVWAATLAELPVLCVLWAAKFKLGVLSIHREALAFAIAGAGWAAGWLLKMAVL